MGRTGIMTSMRELILHNTLTRTKEKFTSIEPGKVRMYTCGPTVYNHIHVGNIRTYVAADLLRRTLAYLGYSVTHVTNITDVDDKTIRGSSEAQLSLAEFTEPYAKSYLEDIQEMNILPPTHSPRATDENNIRAMIDMITKMLEDGFAYNADDGIYFRIGKLPSYGALTDLTGPVESRINNDEYDKESAADFALWKFTTSGDGAVSWEAPFGKGRPGWHIECSAMIHELLGEPIDIHTGGTDLIFPHHTNELAQTEATFGTPLTKIWFHNELVQVEDRKMSKSLGNVFRLADIRERGFSPLAYRYFLLTAHYRQKQNFTWDALLGSEHAYQNLIYTLADFPDGGSISTAYQEKFYEALLDDLGIPNALAILWTLIKDATVQPADRLITALDFDQVLGLKLEQGLKEARDIPSHVTELLQKREHARQNKDWKEADAIRDEVRAQGFVILDTETGPRARKVQ